MQRLSNSSCSLTAMSWDPPTRPGPANGTRSPPTGQRERDNGTTEQRERDNGTTGTGQRDNGTASTEPILLSVGEVGLEAPAPPPVALRVGELDMAARAGAGSLPAPLPMRRYGEVSCCVLCRSKCKHSTQMQKACFTAVRSNMLYGSKGPSVCYREQCPTGKAKIWPAGSIQMEMECCQVDMECCCCM